LSKRKIIKKVTKVLLADYGVVPVLSFCDMDGDQVLIKRYADVKFAIRSHHKHLSYRQQRDRNSGTDGSNGSVVSILRLSARVDDDDGIRMSTLTMSHPQIRDHHHHNNNNNKGSATATEGDVVLNNDEKFHWQKGLK
jgi:hypothetical protein